MNYSFKRTSEIYVIKDRVGYNLTTLSDFTLSQTISEKTITRTSQFKRLAPKRVINRKRNIGTGSLEFYFSNNCPCLALLLESLDMQFDYNGVFTFRNEYSNRPKPIHLCLRDRITGKQTNIEKAYITNVDVRLSPANATLLVFGFEFADSHEEETIAVMQQGKPPKYHAPTYIDFSIGFTKINSVKSAAFTITRELDWLTEGANQFNIGEVAVAKDPIILDYNITALATANDNLSPNLVRHMLPNNQDVLIGNNAFFLKLAKARVTTRKNPEEVFTVSFDIKHQSLQPVLIGGTYNGNIN